MPFDLQQNRISEYSFDGKNYKEDAKRHLIDLLKTAIKSIIDKHDVLLAKGEEQNVQQHDLKIFQGLDEIVNDTRLIDILEHIANSQSVSSVQYDLFDNFIDYLNAERNQFLSLEIKHEAQELSIAMNTMRFALSSTLHRREGEWDSVESENDKVTWYRLPDNRMYFKSYPEYENDKDKRMNRNNDALLKAIAKYRTFRAAVKSNLYI